MDQAYKGSISLPPTYYWPEPNGMAALTARSMENADELYEPRRKAKWFRGKPAYFCY